MRRLKKIIISGLVSLLLPSLLLGQESNGETTVSEEPIEKLEAPLYTPFVERYILDELKQLRRDLAEQRIELIQQVTDRERSATHTAVTYATNTVTYFFYLIAAVSSILVLVGWSSIREIKDKVHSAADLEVSKLVEEYEKRLHVIEKQMTQRTQTIDETKEEIEKTQELHALWLRAGQENVPANKIAIYDQILSINPNDGEALTYKADAVLELGQPEWAINLCQQALTIDKDNSRAFYQLACAHTMLQQYDEAVFYLSEALAKSEDYRVDIDNDPILGPLREYKPFQNMLKQRLQET